ncbi:MAG: hypothetical protein ACO2Y5_04810 [Nitrosopumilaceae archaeon]
MEDSQTNTLHMRRKMNRDPFGEKCTCGHQESQHHSTKPTYKIPRNPMEVGFYFPHPNITTVKRTSCKLCDCKEFATGKTDRSFWRGLSS